MNFHLEKLSLSIKEKKDKDEILKLTVETLNSMLTQRPGAQAIKYVHTSRLYLYLEGVSIQMC